MQPFMLKIFARQGISRDLRILKFDTYEAKSYRTDTGKIVISINF